MKQAQVFLVCVAAVAAVTVAPGLLAAPRKQDAPRPDVWVKFPQLKKLFDAETARLDGYLRSLEPEAFAANYGKLAELAKSEDRNERERAWGAIGALGDLSGVPYLVAALADRPMEDESNLTAVITLSSWIYSAYHDNKRRPPDKLRPLLPVFVKTLVEAGDEPNVRAYCFQAIGSLAGPGWLPLAEDLAGSRHPAVTHWSSWAIQQIKARCGQTEDDPLLGTTYVLPEAERRLIVRAIRKLEGLREAAPGKEEVLYSTGISHFDNWIPYPGTPRPDAPDRLEYYRWRFRGGRVTRVDFVKAGKPVELYRIHYNKAGAPVLCVYCGDGGPFRYAWGDYEDRGMLRRVVQLNDKLQVHGLSLFVNTGVYHTTTKYGFDGKGKLYLRTRYAPDGLFVWQGAGNPDKRVNSGSRLWWLRRFERYGLASVYPIPRLR